MINQIVKKQHQEIRQVIKELREDIYDLESLASGNILLVALKIGTLNGIMQMHLKHEDDFLYPALLNNNENVEIKEIAQKFVTEMGNLAAVFKEYQEKYIRNPEIIRKDLKQFIQETEQILNAISKRIDSEEDELFKLWEANSAK
ncbi:hemerythrin domain-containing protein [Dehalobacterium formicoaceticum]|uniref:Hemerythrin domain-containing protein n=1 Tax=Dehalobacterium formicoaceticum TaxID=51515 RepID=A0ABT1Y4A6_9FIRM|nr:hemerythrin domain-containing protein [Dehalobacterium formicoaceticum]MCR6544749.1 hemerythrin domain-containing protein [Dehalobacterium formicoaceticum]